MSNQLILHKIMSNLSRTMSKPQKINYLRNNIKRISKYDAQLIQCRNIKTNVKTAENKNQIYNLCQNCEKNGELAKTMSKPHYVTSKIK